MFLNFFDFLVQIFFNYFVSDFSVFLKTFWWLLDLIFEPNGAQKTSFVSLFGNVFEKNHDEERLRSEGKG